jgi:hypothetical protein
VGRHRVGLALARSRNRWRQAPEKRDLHFGRRPKVELAELMAATRQTG